MKKNVNMKKQNVIIVEQIMLKASVLLIINNVESAKSEDIPPPGDITALQRFLDKVTYLVKFIHNLSGERSGAS